MGDEGGFAPDINSSKEVIELILESIVLTGLKIDRDIVLSLDVASTEFFENHKYNLKGEKKLYTTDQMID